jgi:hypothetical protein
VNVSTGVVGNALTDNTWFDASGNVIKQQPAGASLFTKPTYDGLRRRLKTYRGYDLTETSYSDIGTVVGDTIIEQQEATYDAASNVIQSVTRMRYHNATGTGELNGPAGPQPKARVTYQASLRDERRHIVDSIGNSSRSIRHRAGDDDRVQLGGASGHDDKSVWHRQLPELRCRRSPNDSRDELHDQQQFEQFIRRLPGIGRHERDGDDGV